jgi:hypothetical protein
MRFVFVRFEEALHLLRRLAWKLPNEAGKELLGDRLSSTGDRVDHLLHKEGEDARRDRRAGRVDDRGLRAGCDDHSSAGLRSCLFPLRLLRAHRAPLPHEVRARDAGCFSVSVPGRKGQPFLPVLVCWLCDWEGLASQRTWL